MDRPLEAPIIVGHVFQVISLISGGCVLTVIISTINLKDDLIAKMTIMIAITEMLYGFPFWMVFPSNWICKARNITGIYTLLSIGLWTICFSRYLKMTVYNHPINPKAFMIYTLVCQTIPLFFSLPMLWYDFSTWEIQLEICRHAPKPGKVDLFMLLEMIIPGLIIMGITFVFCIQSLKRMRYLRRTLQLSLADTYGILLYKPIVTAIIWILLLGIEIAIFIRIDVVKHPEYTYIYDISYLQAFFTAFGFTFLTTVRERIRDCFCKRKTKTVLHIKSSTYSNPEFSKLLEESLVRRSSLSI